MSALPSFRAFFEALWARPPFPWQERLAAEVLAHGWPDLLDLPTGTGKTTALDIALYALAIAPEKLPRRTVLVVDRRIVVDQGAERARSILQRMRDGDSVALSVIADRLRGLWNAAPSADPFAVAVMRGGMPRDNDWARRPDQPVLGVSTIDQVGSRLLFRGYGVSPRSASIHAGLLGNDTLVLLDEVHLAVPFMRTLTTIRKHFMSVHDGLPQRFGVVRMSATAGRVEPDWRVFRLNEIDHADAVLSARLRASKPARLVPLRVTGDDDAKKRELLAAKLVSEALALQREGARVIGIVVNRVDTARLVYQHLDQPEASVVITGRMRPLDRDRVVRQVLLKRAGDRTQRAPDEAPFFVVATQCIEAGADLDFDALVTECASLDALRQRFGRLNRQGLLVQAQAVIVGPSDAVAAGAQDAIYGSALAATWNYLLTHAHGGSVDFGVSALAAWLDEGMVVSEGLIPPEILTPALLPAQLDTWVQTSPLPATEPDIGAWLHGAARPSADVQIVWRSELEVPALDADAEAAAEASVRRLQARRPAALEAVSIPIAAARRWLAGQVPGEIADVMTSADEDDRRPRGDEKQALCALRWRGDDSRFISPNDIRPGDVLVVPCGRGGIAADNFSPDSSEPVTDLADLAQLRARGVVSLLLESSALQVWRLDPTLIKLLPRPEDDEPLVETRQRIANWVGGWPEPADDATFTQKEWRLLVSTLTTGKPRIVRMGYTESSPGESSLLATARVDPRWRDRAEVTEALTEDDDSSFRHAEVTLAKHSHDVRERAEQYAAAVGLAPPLARALSAAAWYHDVGKADPRFQRWLVGGSEIRATLLAKSSFPVGSKAERDAARRRAGYPRGYRHELLSVAMLESGSVLPTDVDYELVLHLVGAHHGWCRPFAPAIDHAEDLEVSLQHGETELRASTRHTLARLDRGVGDRFWSLIARYGWWGLAWLEAILRLADHRASEAETEEAT